MIVVVLQLSAILLNSTEALLEEFIFSSQGSYVLGLRLEMVLNGNYR